MFNLSKSEIIGEEGEIFTLALEGDVKENVIWKSMNEDVVKVHPVKDYTKGVILDFLKEGETFIKALYNGNEYSSKCIVEKKIVYIKNEDFYEKLKHYTGDLHTHTGYSDGQGTPFEAFQYAKENGMADFLAVTDHTARVSGEKWFNTVKAAEEFTDENFISIPSFESGYNGGYIDEDGVQVSNGGELNIFSTADYLKYDTYSKDIREFEDMFKNNPHGIVFYNHPQEASWPTDKLWNAYNEFGDYSEERDKFIVGVETSNETSAYNKIHELVYTIGLDKGWHFSPYATSDTHRGKWTTHFRTRTVVLAPSLTRENIYDAFRDRRVYAVENPNLRIEYKVNGKILGSILNEEESSYKIEAKVFNLKKDKEEEKVKIIQIVSDYGEVVYEKQCKDFDENLNVTLTSNSSRYYFIRVVLQNEERAWTTPVWTGRDFDKVEEVKKGNRISYDNMKIYSVSSELNEHTKGENVLNSDTEVYYESRENTGEIIIDLGELKELVGIGYRKNYVPYEDKDALRKLLDSYEFYVGETVDDFGTPVAKGRVRNYGKEMYKAFSKKGRYVKINALNSVEGGTVAIGNIYIYEK